LATVLNFTKDGPVNAVNGLTPRLVSDGMGYFWGTTLSGGATGLGTVFKVNAISGALKTLVEFTDIAGNQRGNGPYAGLGGDGLGYLWGTTKPRRTAQSEERFSDRYEYRCDDKPLSTSLETRERREGLSRVQNWLPMGWDPCGEQPRRAALETSERSSRWMSSPEF
jgi:uncharacterized repeat protein (TIGR03803 family)